MDRSVFDTLDDEALCLSCFTPLLTRYKQISAAGEDLAAFFQRLSHGQQKLFVIRAYYEHARRNTGELYGWTAFFMAQPLRWESLRASLRKLDDEHVLALLEEMEQILTERGHPLDLDQILCISQQDLQHDEQLNTIVTVIYEQLHPLWKDTMSKLAGYIRNHPLDYVHFHTIS